MKQIELQILFALTCLACVNATNIPSSDWPVLEFEKGETAYLPCPPQGHANAFFWRKGEWFNISESIASIVHGISDTTEKYDVLGDGTLVILNMSFEDEGKYYCRIASERNECHGSITLYLKVSSEAIDIAIEGCTSSSSCVKILEPFLEFQLTCTANMIAESMTLKWYNGSKEIIGVVDVSSTFGEKVMITNVIKFIFKDESRLTCEAEGVNTASGSAAIQLKKKEVFIPVENEATLTLLVPTIVLGIICLILTCILIYLSIRYWKLNNVPGKKKGDHSVEMNQNVKEPGNDKKEQNAEGTSLIPPQEENDTDLATKLKKELQTLRGEIKEKDDALIENNKTIKGLRTKMEETNKDLVERNEELLSAKEQLKNKETEQLQGTGENKEKANSVVENLQKNLQEAENKISAAEDENRNLKRELEETKKKLATAGTTGKKLPGELEETRKKLATAETTEKNLQRELEETRKKLITAATTEKNLHRELEDTNKKLTTAETTGKRELEDTRKKLTTAATTAKNLQRELEDTRKKLAIAVTTGKKLEEELEGAKTKLSSNETTIEKLGKDLQEERVKRSKCENANEIIITKIIEMKDKILRNLPESSPAVIFAVKGVLPKGSSRYEDLLPKHKYRDVSLVSGPSCNGDIFDKMKDKVEACFHGINTTIFLFGRFESGLHHTLHGENKDKGLIARVTHQIFLLSNQLKEDGFQVNINVTVASIEGKGNFWKFLSPSDPPEGKDKFTLANGVKIILNRYNVQSEQSLFKIASFMTPTRSNPVSDGLLKITVEALLGPTTVSKGCFIIASISNLVKVPKILKGKPEDNFGELLFLLTSSNKSDLVLIPKVDPALEREPRKTFEAVKTALDDYR